MYPRCTLIFHEKLLVSQLPLKMIVDLMIAGLRAIDSDFTAYISLPVEV